MNPAEIMRQMGQMQKKLKKAQEEAEKITAEGTAGGGMVTVVASGRRQIEQVTIEKEVVNPDDVEMLQDLITAAANQALSRVDEQVQAEMAKLTGGLGLPPGLF